MPASSINMSLKAYLEQFRGKTDDWAIDLLDVAYNIEFGLLTEDQSSLAHGGFHRHRYEQAVCRCSARATRSSASRAVRRR